MANPIPFGLNGTTTKVTATGTSANGTISMGGNTSILVTNTGTATAFIRSSPSAATAVVTDTPVIAGSAQTFSIPPDHVSVAAITAGTSCDVYFTVGSGQ